MDLDYTYLEIEIHRLKQQIEAMDALNAELNEKLAKRTPESSDERVKQLEEEKAYVHQMLKEMLAYRTDETVDVYVWQDYIDSLNMELESARAQIEQLTNENTVLARKFYDLQEIKEPSQEIMDFKQCQESFVQYEALISEQRSALEEKTQALEEAKKLSKALEEEAIGRKAEINFLEKAKAELSAQITRQDEAIESKQKENNRMKDYLQTLLTITKKQEEFRAYYKAVQEKHLRELEQARLEREQQREHEKMYSKMLSDTFQSNQKKDQAIKEAENKLKALQQENKVNEADQQYRIKDLEVELRQVKDDLNRAKADISAYYAKYVGNPASVSQLFVEKSLDLSKSETGVSRAASQLRATSRCLRGITQ